MTTLLAYVLPPIGAVSLMIFAQTTGPIDPTGVVAPVANISAVGILIWYVWYNQTRTIPGITKDHKELVASITEKHAANIEKLTTDFKSEVASERSQCLAQHKDNEKQHEATQYAVVNLDQKVTLHHALVGYVVGLKGKDDGNVVNK